MTETIQNTFHSEEKKKLRPIITEETLCFDLLRIKCPKKNQTSFEMCQDLLCKRYRHLKRKRKCLKVSNMDEMMHKAPNMALGSLRGH